MIRFIKPHLSKINNAKVFKPNGTNSGLKQTGYIKHKAINPYTSKVKKIPCCKLGFDLNVIPTET